MSKPLSQEEIDLLLRQKAEGDPRTERKGLSADPNQLGEDEQAQPYNFKRPRLFSQAQTRVLNYVHESFARDLSVYLSAQLRTIVDISLTAVDQVLYSEFVMSSAPPSALYVLEDEDLEHKSIFEIDPRLVIYAIEKLFGGKGEFLKEPREISPIEQRIMSRVMQQAFRELEQAWQKAYDLSVNDVAFESNAEFVQIIPAAEPALVASFEVRIYDEPSFVNICYPYLMLEKMLGRAGMKQWISSSTTPSPPKVRERYEDALRTTDVTLSAELGRAVLPVTELMQLEEGDVIPLDSTMSDSMQVYVNDKPKFKAAAGRSGQKRALQITSVQSPAPDPTSPSLNSDPDPHESEHAHDARAEGAGSADRPPHDPDGERSTA